MSHQRHCAACDPFGGRNPLHWQLGDVAGNAPRTVTASHLLPRTPALATDCVVFDPLCRVLLIRRGHEPCTGKHALPGGFVKISETVASTCRREVKEQTGIEVTEISVVGVYSDIDRDSRGHIVNVAFMTELTNETPPRVGSDARSAEWVD